MTSSNYRFKDSKPWNTVSTEHLFINITSTSVKYGMCPRFALCIQMIMECTLQTLALFAKSCELQHNKLEVPVYLFYFNTKKSACVKY